MTGTYLHVPDLNERLKNTSHSQLALEAIRNKQTAPFGAYQNTQKMTMAFLNYVCQIAYNTKGPKDIIQHKQCGYLVETPAEMQERIVKFLMRENRTAFKAAAAERAAAYKPDAIIAELMRSVEM